MNLLALHMAECRRNIKMTILYRKGGTWHPIEVTKLANGLMTEVSEHSRFPEYLVLFDHHTKEETLDALGGGVAYTATPIVGADNKELPFSPGFI